MHLSAIPNGLDKPLHNNGIRMRDWGGKKFIPPHPNSFILPDKQEAFAWSDPDVAGSRLDPQTADFARRATELWTQAAGLRELTSRHQGREGNSDGGIAALAVALDQVHPAPC